MKYAILLASLVLSLNLQAARTISVYGSGYYNGSCDGNNAFFCVDSIKQNARRDALSRADLDCRIMKNGKTQPSYTASCNYDYCTPAYIPMNAPSQYVTCRSECSISCEIED